MHAPSCNWLSISVEFLFAYLFDHSVECILQFHLDDIYVLNFKSVLQEATTKIVPYF